MGPLQMKAFTAYVDGLIGLVGEAVAGDIGEGHVQEIRAALDGQPALELRRSVSRENRRAAGAFFTGSDMARKVIGPAIRDASGDSTFLDPACGVGDLLIAVARRMEVASDLGTTLASWGERLIGRELQPAFVRATKARLVLTALSRGVPRGRSPVPAIEQVFPSITCGCGLLDTRALGSVTHIVLNPPFTMTDAPRGCEWTSGSVNTAALFVASCVRHARPGTRLIAILPDVLRSGTRYARWRRFVQSRARLRGVRTLGQFDQWADVDVFSLAVGIAQQRPISGDWTWGHPRGQTRLLLRDLFEIHVGPVVPHRHLHRGPWCPYVRVHDIPAWGTVTDIRKRRRFSGRAFSPPFVLVRRTSRPGEKSRAVGTIVEGDRPVAVENHLIVLRPRDGTKRLCRRLLAKLRHESVNRWLDRRIRCRHLTVSALAQMPWGRDE